MKDHILKINFEGGGTYLTLVCPSLGYDPECELLECKDCCEKGIKLDSWYEKCTAKNHRVVSCNVCWLVEFVDNGYFRLNVDPIEVPVKVNYSKERGVELIHNIDRLDNILA